MNTATNTTTAKKVTKAELLRSGATRQKGRAYKAANSDLSFDEALESFVRDEGKVTTSAMAMAIRMFKEFDDWDVNDPQSVKPKAGTSWVAAIDGSAYTDNEKARKVALLEVKAKVKDLAVVHCPSNPNSPWSRIMNAGRNLLGGNAKGPDLRTSQEKSCDDFKRVYRRLMKDESLNEEGLELQRATADILTAFYKVDLAKLG